MRYVIDIEPLGNEKRPRRSQFVLHKAGPFIGPQGGKWADAKHTIPWKERKAIPGKGKVAEQWSKLPSGKSVQEHAQIARRFLRQHRQNLPKAIAAMKSLAGDGQVKGRTKTLESALGKVIRKPKYGTVDKLQDGTGLRVVHKSVKEVKDTVQSIREKYKVIEEDDYITNPQGNYRSHHLIIEGPGGLAMEIQVRTENQNVFADWAHDVYKPVTEEQAKLQKDPQVAQYEKSMADYFWSLDTGQEPPPKPPCPITIKKTFGCL